MVAKSAFAKHALTRDHSQIYREYLAVCEGRWGIPQGRIEHPIGRVAEGVDRWTVRPDGRPAVTEYRILKENQEWTVLKIHLLTGRTTRSGSILPTKDTRWWGIPCTGQKTAGSPVRLSTPGPSVSGIPGPEKRCSSPHRMPGEYGGACWGRKAVQSEEQEGKRQTTNPQDCLKGRSDLSPKI